MGSKETAIRPTDVTDFITYLVELGEVYHVDGSNMSIKTIEDDKLLCIPTGNDPDGPSLPLVVYYDKMPVGDFIVLNPFSDLIEEGKELNWFWGTREATMRFLLKEVIKTIIRFATAAEEELEKVSYGNLDIITEFKDDIDAKTMKELEKIKPTDLLKIFYSKREKVAQLQCKIFDEETVASYKATIRKKTWRVFHGIVEKILGTSDFKEHFTCKAAGISVPKAEAVLAVMAKGYARMEEYLEKLLQVETNVATFMRHLPNVEKYYHLTKFISGSQLVAAPITKTSNLPPWQATPLPIPNAANVLPVTEASRNPPPAFTIATPTMLTTANRPPINPMPHMGYASQIQQAPYTHMAPAPYGQLNQAVPYGHSPYGRVPGPGHYPATVNSPCSIIPG